MNRKVPCLTILAHEADDFWGPHRLIHLLMARWKDMRWDVRLATDPMETCHTDLALLHVSLSVVPEDYRRLAARYPRVINGTVVDIRKRRFSRLLVDRDGPDPGPVIVKTNANAGGWRELRGSLLESRFGRGIGRLDARGSLLHEVLRLEAARPWHKRRIPRFRGYPIYESRDLVPDGVWRNPNLVVERFVTERRDEVYVCRHWLFFGSREVTRRTMSLDPVVKFRGVMEQTRDRIPEELRAIREELGFDYGKFDYAIVNGEVVLYDVNRTPHAASDPRIHRETIDILAPGIEDFQS